MKLEKWQAALGVATIVVGSVGYPIYQHFAKAADLEIVATDVDRNADATFRLEQIIINNTRADREERGLKPNPQWLQQQQKDLDYRRCLHRQQRDRKVRCDK